MTLTSNEMVRRLAKACCLGWRQESFVNELLRGPVRMHLDKWDRAYYGRTKMSYSSWKGLRTRLAKAGFVIIDDWLTVEIEFEGWEK